MSPKEKKKEKKKEKETKDRYQETRTGGDAYIGIITTSNIWGTTYDTREYIQTRLRKKMKKQKKYCVGVYANLGVGTTPGTLTKASKDLGILLTKDRIINDGSNPAQPRLIIGQPQVKADHYLKDTLNWELVHDIFTPQEDYEWLTIGVFKPNWQADDSLVFNVPGFEFFSYYFIDDVFVIPMENDEALVHKDTSVCASGFPIQITANTGFTGYTWNNGTQSQSLTINVAGTYTVSATYAGCTIVDTIRVRTASVPSLVVPNYSVCDNELPLTVALPPAVTDVFDAFAWSNGDVGANAIVQTANTYTVTATMECGSTSTNFVVTTAPEPPDFTLGNDTSYCVSGKPVTLILKPNVLLPNYQWNTGATTQSIVVQKEGIYKLNTSNACGTKTDEIKIDGCPPNYYIPNTFTPNDDGQNDIFTVFATESVVNIKSMQIFNRWGEFVFTTQNVQPTRGLNAGGGFWDGMFKGQPAITDAYVYVIVIEFADGTTETVTGDVTLLR